ncbi:hypothetical protein JRI60_02045 [Archangium violaceum]|uniref:hypothetical protein n=1 Tax=Archangium violaceum TaxID=83451 RepID=UPI00194E4802|nr:hypothetical protein [Archangium violaceum]QRN97888.1 hypothetical protein JRI60_02045 [Archangium violaceum]
MFRTVVVALFISLLAVPAPSAHAAPAKTARAKTSKSSKSAKTKAKASKKSSRKSVTPAPAESGEEDAPMQPAAKQAEPARPEAAPPSPMQPAETRPSDAPVKQEESDMDFDLLESSTTSAEAPRAVDPALERAIAQRRTMLTIHQGVGIAMAATLTATIVVGQLNLNDRYRGGGGTDRYKGLHTGLVIGSSTLFAGTGLLGLLAPTPFKKELRLDTITLHKIFMSLATAGMLTQVALGVVTAQHEGKLSQVGLVTAHQVIGYATLGAVGAGMLMLTF